jgi:hypothetical protein
MPLYVPTAARRSLGSRFVFKSFLPFSDIGQNFTRPLVLDNRSLIDLL